MRAKPSEISRIWDRQIKSNERHTAKVCRKRPNELNNKKLTTNQTIEIHGQFTPFPIRSDCRQFSVMLHKYTRANNNNEKMFGFFFPTWDNQQRRHFEWQSKESKIDCPKTEKKLLLFTVWLLFVFWWSSAVDKMRRGRQIHRSIFERYFRYANWSSITWNGWQFRVKHFSHQYAISQFFKRFSMLYNKIGYGACLMATVKNYWCWLNINIVNFQWKSCS